MSQAAEFWSGWLPLLIAIGLIVLAVVVGLVVRSARGYLPFAARWLMLTAALVLSIWNIVDVVARPALPVAVAHVNTKAREEADALFLAAKTPHDKRVAEQAREAADGLEAFGELLTAGAKQGIDVPTARQDGDADASLPAGADAAAILREYGPALAAGELPGALEPLAEELGVDVDALLMQAGMALATEAIAEYFGMPYAVAFKILVALLADGELSPGEIIRLGTAVAFSVGADGLDMELFSEQFDNVGQYAHTLDAFMSQAEAMGLAEHVNPELWQVGRALAQDVAGAGGAVSCDAAAIQRALIQAPNNEDEQVRRLARSDNEACRNLSDAELRAAIRSVRP